MVYECSSKRDSEVDEIELDSRGMGQTDPWASSSNSSHAVDPKKSTNAKDKRPSPSSTNPQPQPQPHPDSRLKNWINPEDPDWKDLSEA
jgi:hypothetical protein